MDIKAGRIENNARLEWRLVAIALLLAALSFAMSARALNIQVLGSDGAAVTDFRWIVEEDQTKASIPGQPANGTNLSLGFHQSYMRVVNSGETPTTSIALDPAKRYFVSVLPRGGYQLGGAPVSPGQSAVTIWVNKLPIPTAQLSLFVFEDNQPINGVANLPQELGLGGFSVILAEAGGVYGQSGGQVTKDAFGNPLGTTYQRAPSGEFLFGLLCVRRVFHQQDCRGVRQSDEHQCYPYPARCPQA